MTTAELAEAFAATLPSWQPPPAAMSYREFTGTMKIPDGPQAGDRLDPDSEPAMIAIHQALDGEITDCLGGTFREIIDVACTQVGKTLRSIIVPSLRSVVQLRQSVVYCLPTADLLNKVWIDKLDPAIIGVGYGKYRPRTGPGSRSGRPTSFVFRDPDSGQRLGSFIFIAGGSGKKREAGQAGVTAGLVLIDEADEYETAHRVALIKQRAVSFGERAVTIIASTVKKNENSTILALYDETTASRLWFACPHCTRFQVLEWENVRYDPADAITAADTARYHCPHCAVGWTEADRRRALRKWKIVHKGQSINEAGELIGPIPRVATFGLLTTKLDYHLGDGMPKMAQEHRAAKQIIDTANDHGLMESFYRDRLSRSYTGALVDEEGGAANIDPRFLAHRSAHSAFGPALPDKGEGFSHYWSDQPKEVEWLTAAIDVQGDRLYWSVIGWDSANRSYDLAWGYDYACPIGSQATAGELQSCLDRVKGIIATGPTGGWLTAIVRKGVDVGFHQDWITPWLAVNREWLAVKGIGDHQMHGAQTKMEGADPHERSLDIKGAVYLRRQKDGTVIYFVESASVREQAQGAFLAAQTKPGAAHLPKGVAGKDSYIRHLCALKLEIKNGVHKWALVQKRHDYLDLRVYHLALNKFHVEQIRRDATRLPPSVRRYGLIGKTD